MAAPDINEAPSKQLLTPETCQWLGLDLEELLHKLGKPVQGSRTKRVMNSVFEFLSDPTTSLGARLFSAAMFLVILLSTIAFVLGTLESLNRSNPEAFDTIELVCVVIFTIDYGLRFITCPYSRIKFVIQPLNIIDLISILPWYIGIAMQNSSVSSTSVFRVLRLLRVLKIVNRQSGISVIVATLVRSWDMLLLVCFFVVLLLVAVSTCMFMLERGDWDDQLGYYVRPNENRMATDDAGNGFPMASPFSSVPEGFWWAIVTMLTVGYGDIVPTTPGGKALAMLTMFLGITTLALPIGMIGTTFTTLWGEYQENNNADRKSMPAGIQELDAACAEHITSSNDLINLFSTVDRQVEDLRSKLSSKLEAFHKEHKHSMVESFSPSTLRGSSILALHPGPLAESIEPVLPTPAQADLGGEALQVTEVDSEGHNAHVLAGPPSMRQPGGQDQLPGDASSASPERVSGVAPLPPIQLRSSRNSFVEGRVSARVSRRMFGDALDPASDARIKELLDSIQPEITDRELQSVVQLHNELQERVKYMQELIKTSQLLACQGFPEQVTRTRITMAQITAQQQAQQGLLARIQEAEADAHQVEALAQELQRQLHGMAPSGSQPPCSSVFHHNTVGHKVMPEPLTPWDALLPAGVQGATAAGTYSKLRDITLELKQAQASGTAESWLAALRAQLRSRRQLQ